MKNVKKKNVPQENHHFIFVELPKEKIWPELVRWGEAAWWPKKCSMIFSRATPEDIQVGTRYKLKVKALLGPRFDVEVSRLDQDRAVERRFVKGFIKGHEVVKLEESSNGTRVEYELHYEIVGAINRILWSLFYAKQHDKNILVVLQALEKYLMKNYQEQVEKQMEGE